jgi:hypothetical protein
MRFELWTIRSLYRSGLLNDGFEGAVEIEVRFSGSTGGQIGGRWH